MGRGGSRAIQSHLRGDRCWKLISGGRRYAGHPVCYARSKIWPSAGPNSIRSQRVASSEEDFSPVARDCGGVIGNQSKGGMRALHEARACARRRVNVRSDLGLAMFRMDLGRAFPVDS